MCYVIRECMLKKLTIKPLAYLSCRVQCRKAHPIEILYCLIASFPTLLLLHGVSRYKVFFSWPPLLIPVNNAIKNFSWSNLHPYSRRCMLDCMLNCSFTFLLTMCWYFSSLIKQLQGTSGTDESPWPREDCSKDCRDETAGGREMGRCWGQEEPKGCSDLAKGRADSPNWPCPSIAC